MYQEKSIYQKGVCDVNRKYCDVVNKKDFICGLSIIIFSAIVFLQTVGGESQVVLFPKIVSLVFLFMGLGSIAVSLKDKDRDRERKETKNSYGLELIFSVFMAGVMFMAEVVGFYTCVFIICCGCYGVLKFLLGEKGIKSILGVVIFSLVTTTAMFLAFNVLLGIITPTGFLI
jgi:hypothetical protein